MNSTSQRSRLLEKRYAVRAWIESNDISPEDDGVVQWHYAYLERLSDACAYLLVRIAREERRDAARKAVLFADAFDA